MKHLGIVPARGGSKRIPDKNLAILGNYPLVHHTLKAALSCASLDRSILTTNDPKIRALALKLGFAAPFLRSPMLSTDEAQSIDVVLHALDWLEEHEHYCADTVVLLQPTSPFRDGFDIARAIADFEEAGESCLVSISDILHSPRDIRRVANGRFLPLEMGQQGLRDENLVFENGAIYITKVSFLRSERKFFDESAALTKLDPIHGFDIDTPAQLEIARGLAATLK